MIIENDTCFRYTFGEKTSGMIEKGVLFTQHLALTAAPQACPGRGREKKVEQPQKVKKQYLWERSV